MAGSPTGPRCRACRAPLQHVFADLGQTPVANAFRRVDDTDRGEMVFPLKAFVCEACWLVQLQDFHRPESLFTEDYPYFSSFSESWLRHADAYATQMVARLDLGPQSLVAEIASNDGYLLQYFKVRGIPALGIEPAAAVAAAARRDHGIDTIEEFFGRPLASRLTAEGRQADLLVANNVLAHVPDINDFLGGFSVLLKPDGMATFEFPHLANLIQLTQYDTIYHEHYSYLSLAAVELALRRNDLKAVDVEELPTHGGSLRVFARHAFHASLETDRLTALRERENAMGITQIETYHGFADRVRRHKRELLHCLIDLKNAGATIAAYGAPAKGNTLLNYCGIGRDFIDYTVDRNPQKQGMVLPGTRIPVTTPDRIFATRPDYLLILPWNLRDEIIGQMDGIRRWGGKFILPAPEVMVL